MGRVSLPVCLFPLNLFQKLTIDVDFLDVWVICQYMCVYLLRRPISID